MIRKSYATVEKEKAERYEMLRSKENLDISETGEIISYLTSELSEIDKSRNYIIEKLEKIEALKIEREKLLKANAELLKSILNEKYGQE